MSNGLEMPDFSGDDFANDPEIKKARAKEEAYEKMVEASLDIVRKELGVELASPKNLGRFLMFRSVQAYVTRSMASSDQGMPVHVSVVSYHSSFPTARNRNSGTDEYLFGLLPLQVVFPPTYACRETLSEKITDLFVRSEVDFEHSKRFSRRFHLLTQDRFRLQELLQYKNLDELAAYPQMELEIQGSFCLFRSSQKAISPKEAKVFAGLAKTLVKVLG